MTCPEIAVDFSLSRSLSPVPQFLCISELRPVKDLPGKIRRGGA